MILVYQFSGCRNLLKDKTDDFLINPNLEHEGTFNIYFPHEGFEIEPGEILTIKWYSRPDVDYVDLYLFRKSTQTLTIELKKKNSGEYAWNIPTDLHWSLHYSIKIQDHYSPEIFGYSDSFSIIIR